MVPGEGRCLAESALDDSDTTRGPLLLHISVCFKSPFLGAVRSWDYSDSDVRKQTGRRCLVRKWVSPSCAVGGVCEGSGGAHQNAEAVVGVVAEPGADAGGGVEGGLVPRIATWLRVG